MKIETGKVLLFGDSLTDYFPETVLEGLHTNIKKAGVPGDTLPQMKVRLEPVLSKERPDVVVIQGGINDYLFCLYRGAEVISAQLVELGKHASKVLPEARILVESLYPMDTKSEPGAGSFFGAGQKGNSEIRKINRQVQKLCRNAHLEYVDVYGALADDQGRLVPEDTCDGVHLTKSGYEKVAEILSLYI